MSELQQKFNDNAKWFWYRTDKDDWQGTQAQFVHLTKALVYAYQILQQDDLDEVPAPAEAYTLAAITFDREHLMRFHEGLAVNEAWFPPQDPEKDGRIQVM